MAGRGRDTTLPAWMTSSVQESLPGSTADKAGIDGGISSSKRKRSSSRSPPSLSSIPKRTNPGNVSGGTTAIPKKSKFSDPSPSSASSLDQPSSVPTSSSVSTNSAPSSIDTKALIAAAMANAAFMHGTQSVPSFASSLLASSSSAGPSTSTAGVSRSARRLYVSNLPAAISENALQSFFNDVLLKVYPHGPGGPYVFGVSLDNAKRFAFLEFTDPYLTSAALALDGISYQNTPLRLRRPHDYNPVTMAPTGGTPVVFDLSQLNIISSQVPNGPNKLFIGGLARQLASSDVISMLEPFGKLKGFHLVADSASGGALSKGYAFAEFADPSVTPIVIQGLNGMEVLGRPLTVKYADPASMMAAAGVGATGLSGPAGQGTAALTGTADGNTPSVSTPLSEYSYNQPPSTTLIGSSSSQLANTNPTRMLRLSNMVSVEELRDDDEYNDILLDVKEELQKFGTVVRIEIPREGKHVGYIFVEFQSVQESMQASKALAGRSFASRIVVVEYIDEISM
jgi:splicing factor U2AF 65 kDa subunit